MLCYGHCFRSIVNISTNAAQYNAFEIHGGASKAALEAYTRALSVALGGYGIRVNTVAPGPVHTGIPQLYITPERSSIHNLFGGTPGPFFP